MPAQLVTCLAADRALANAAAQANVPGAGPDTFSVPLTTNSLQTVLGLHAVTHYGGHYAAPTGAQATAIASTFGSAGATALGRATRTVDGGLGQTADGVLASALALYRLRAAGP